METSSPDFPYPWLDAGKEGILLAIYIEQFQKAAMGELDRELTEDELRNAYVLLTEDLFYLVDSLIHEIVCYASGEEPLPDPDAPAFWE